MSDNIKETIVMVLGCIGIILSSIAGFLLIVLLYGGMIGIFFAGIYLAFKWVIGVVL